MSIEVFARTDPGPVRENNEDSFLVEPTTGLFAVADGMGGHAAGEVASQIAVETIKEIILESDDPDETRVARPILDGEELLRERLRYAMNQASARIRQHTVSHPNTRGMGTTLTILYIQGETAHISHVGDSRIYLFRDEELSQLTMDHTVVQKEIQAGRLTPELARVAPHKNILTQSVGFNATVHPHSGTHMGFQDDIYLICSDGLSDVLDRKELEALFQETPFEDLAEELVQQAISSGTEDNVTVVLVRVVEEG